MGMSHAEEAKTLKQGDQPMLNPTVKYSLHVATEVSSMGTVYRWKALGRGHVYQSIKDAWARVQELENLNPHARYSVVVERATEVSSMGTVYRWKALGRELTNSQQGD